MFRFLSQTRIALPLAILVTASLPAAVDAGWMGFRNDTRSTLVIQESVSSGRVVSRVGKPQRIYTNETIRDTSATPAGTGRLRFLIRRIQTRHFIRADFPVRELERMCYLCSSWMAREGCSSKQFARRLA